MSMAYFVVEAATDVSEFIARKATPRCTDLGGVKNLRYCCSVLQCVAVCYSVLQRVVACCSVLQCAAPIQAAPRIS